MNLGFAGRFTVEKQKVAMRDGQPALDSDGNQMPMGTPWIEAEFDNLITDSGLDELGNGDPLTYMYLSSDNTSPTINDNSLQGFLASAAITSVSAGSKSLTSPIFFSNYYETSFAAGIGTGNITKIATGWTSDATGLWSTALVQNGGSPTVITKLADEILKITYQLKFYISDNDYIGNVTISGNTHEVTVRPVGLNQWGLPYLSEILDFKRYKAYDSGLVGRTEYPSGTNDNLGMSKLSYIPSSFEKGFVFSAVTSAGNYPDGIKLATMEFYEGTRTVYWQVGFNPPIMKTENDTLTLPPFYVKWGRYVAP